MPPFLVAGAYALGSQETDVARSWLMTHGNGLHLLRGSRQWDEQLVTAMCLTV